MCFLKLKPFLLYIYSLFVSYEENSPQELPVVVLSFPLILLGFLFFIGVLVHDSYSQNES